MDATVLWAGYPSWKQFAWLYFMAAMVLWRALLFWRVGFSGWMSWALGAVLLLGTAVALRQWARYELQDSGLIVRNGYTGREIGAMAAADVHDVALRRGPIASALGIGTVVATSAQGRALRFRGVADPETVKTRIERVVRVARSTGAAA